MVLKKIAEILIIIAFPFNISCQENESAYYSLVFKNCCSSEIEQFGTIYTDWKVYEDNGIFVSPKNNKVRLVKGKKYILKNEGFGILEYPIFLTDSLKIDTMSTSCLMYKYPTDFFSWNPLHLNCYDTINGQYLEYYWNNTIRLKGLFDNGKIKDTLQEFYSNGKQKSLLLFSNSDTIYTTYYPSGQISYLYHSGGKNKFSYFPNGKVKSTSSTRKIKEINKYSENQIWYSITAKKQVSYNRNGNINQKVTQKPLFFLDHFRIKRKSRFFKYNYKTYDTNGVILREIIFYSNNFIRLYSIDLYKLANSFSYLTFFENGLPKIKFYADYKDKDVGKIPLNYLMFKYENGKLKTSKNLSYNEFIENVEPYEKTYKKHTSP